VSQLQQVVTIYEDMIVTGKTEGMDQNIMEQPI
jgi:hypothetical protein